MSFNKKNPDIMQLYSMPKSHLLHLFLILNTFLLLILKKQESFKEINCFFSRIWAAT